MKKHAIIPIFIPHKGCPHDCVFCNQRAITARTADVTPDDVRRIAEQYLSTLEGRGLDEIEISFFGGSFTGIPMEEQSAFLAVAKDLKDAGRVKKIHLSTRPDYINREILDNLKAYGADVIELGVQSFDENVLMLSGRGHGRKEIFDACELIKSYGCFTLGIQLMIGLPGDSYESCIASAKEAVSIGPEIARLYPTVIISDTELCSMYRSGEFVPFTHEEMLRTTTDIYRILTSAGINVIRVGLKSTALISDAEGSSVVGEYHPAFRQLVEGRIAREETEAKLSEIEKEAGKGRRTVVIIKAGPDRFSSVIGHKAENKRYFRERFPELQIRYEEDPEISGNDIIVEKQG